MIQFLVALALCYVLIKIPFWILGSLRGGGGRSLIGGLIRGFIAYKTFGLLKGAGGGRSPSRARGTRKSTEPPDPYAKSRANSDGQYTLPLNVKRVRKPSRPKPEPVNRRSRGKDPEQLELPLDGEWPENKPRLNRDGQYQMPFKVERKPKPERPKPQPEQKPSPHKRGRQLPLPLDGEWPENKPRLNRGGQYELPFDVKRVRRPTPPPPDKPRRSGPNRQTKLPLDGEWPENKPRRGRDGQYELPLNVQRTRKPSTSGQPQTPPSRSQRRGPRPRQQQLPLDLPQLDPPRPSTRRRRR
ncbi:hypothetical protein [Saccharopolyspora antimicrobica]|uniref:hypothetical protein n=1 Tax=Saccharopolyspora antimicrobica TaxID=455193 RepID=UPI001FE61DC5|nr:hypothetical protein [Saccharopolyspora antimicrobica]